MSAVYDERTQPVNALLAKMWFLLLSHCERFTLRTDGADVVVEARGKEHRVPGSIEGLSMIRRIAKVTRGAGRKRPADKTTPILAATLAAVTHEWQRTSAIAEALDVSADAAIYHLTALHRAGRVERRGVRPLTWRLPQ